MTVLSLLQWPKSGQSSKRLELPLLQTEAHQQPWLLIKCCNLHVPTQMVDRTITVTDVLKSALLLHALRMVQGLLLLWSGMSGL